MEDNIFITFSSFFNFEIWTSPRSWIKKEITLVLDPRVSWGGSSSLSQAEVSITAPRRESGMAAEHFCSGKAEQSEPGRRWGSNGEPQESDLPLHKWCSYPFLPCPVLRAARATTASSASPAGRALAAPFHPHIHSSPWLNNPQQEYCGAKIPASRHRESN